MDDPARSDDTRADFQATTGDVSFKDLPDELLNKLESPESERRESSFATLSALIVQGLYTPDQLRAMIAVLQTNLGHGLGESGTDSVFARSFSALVLGKIVDLDSLHPLLDQSDIRELLERSLVYLTRERDLRGHSPDKGWIHTAAHAGDLLAALAKSPRLDARDLERLLNAIATKMTAQVEHVYLHFEDERLAYAVMSALRRDLLSDDFLARWCTSLGNPPNWPTWDEILVGTPSQMSAWHNTREFLRSLYLQLVFVDQTPACAPRLLPRLAGALRAMDQGFYQLR